MKRYLKAIVGTVIGLFVVYTFYFLWKQSQPAPVVYELISPTQGDIQRHCTASGQIDARRQVDVKPRITGILKELLVHTGQEVNVGDVIARVEVIPDMSSLNIANSEVKTAKLQLEETQREFNRTKSLYGKGVVSKEEYEMMSNRLDLAKESLAKAKSSEDIVLKGSSTRTGNVNTTVITATMKGVIIDLPLKVGASVVATSMFSSGTTIATIADMSNLQFTGKIDETEVEKLHPGMPVSITIGAMKKHVLKGSIEEIASMGNKDHGTIMFEIKASVETPQDVNVIRAGYSANADIVTDERKNVLAIEEAAVEFEGDKTYVYVLLSPESETDNQRFEQREVSTGLSDGIRIELISGVKAGETLRGNKKD